MSYRSKSVSRLRGGFSGSETACSERDLAVGEGETNPGSDLNGDDGPNFARHGDYGDHVLEATNVDFQGAPGTIRGIPARTALPCRGTVPETSFAREVASAFVR